MATLFRTGDGEVTDTIIVALELVDNDWFKRSLIGALELMCNAANWTQNGTADVDFARDKANEMLEKLELDVIIPFVPIGATMLWWDTTIPDKWLKMDNTAHAVADYPELFAIFGYAYGGGGTMFNFPTMQSFSPMGVGGFIGLGATAGNTNQPITQANLPNVALPITDPGHIHTLTDPGHTHDEQVGSTPAYLGTGGTGRTGFSAVVTSSTTRVVTDSKVTGATVASHTTGVAVGTGGGDTALPIVHPVRGCYFIIYAGR